MMLDAVTFDLGSARPPLFTFPDVSELAPLTLPDEFLRGQSHQPQAELPTDTVRRFETVMSAGPPLPPSVVKSVMACMIPESRKSEIASVVTSVPVASGDGPAVVAADTVVEKASTLSADKPVASVVQTPTVVTVERPEVPAVEVPKVVIAERPVVATTDNPTIATIERPVIAVAEKPAVSVAEHPAVATVEAPKVAIVETPVAVDKPIGAPVGHSVRVAVEGSGVVLVDPTIPAGSVLRSVNENPVVASPERPVVQVRATTPEEPIVLVAGTPILSVDKPVASVVQAPTVVTVEKPEATAVEAPKVVTIEKPATVVLPTEHTVVPAVVENLNSRVEAKEQPVAVDSIPAIPATPTTPDASVAKSVAMVETPVAVEKPMGTSGERPVRVVVEGSSVTQANTTIQEGSAVRSAAERPVVESSEQPTIQVIATTPEEPIVSGEKTPTLSADKPMASVVQTPTVVTIEQPVIAGADKPVVSATEHPTVATVEVPKVVTIEKPVTVILPPEHTVVPAVVENLNSRVEAEEHLVAVGSIPASPATPAASSAKPVGMVEPPVAVDKPIGVSVEHSVRVAVGESEVVSVNAPIPSGSVRRSANENPVVASSERPAMQVSAAIPEERIVIVEKTPTLSADKPVASAVEVPKVVTVERPVVPAVEAPKVVVVERPVVATTDNPMIVTIERSVVSPAAHTVVPVVVENLNSRVEVKEQPVTASGIPATPVAPSAKPVSMVETPVAVDKPVAASPEPSKRQAIAATPIEPTVTIEKASVPPTETPSAATVEIPKVATVERPQDVASVDKPVSVVSPSAPTVVSPSAPTVVLPSAPTVAPVVFENPVNRVQAEGRPVVVSNTPTAPDAPVVRPGASVEAPVIAVPAKPNGTIEKTPVVPSERPVAAKVSNPTVAAVDKPEEKAVAAAAHVVVAPAAVEASAPQVLQAAPEVAAASAASARTEAIVETVNQIVESVVGQILVTPGITHGECEIKIMLKPTVLDGSEVTMSAKDGTLTVSITPATQEASAAAAAALPRLEIALAEHAPAFHHVSVALQLKKGNRNEAV